MPNKLRILQLQLSKCLSKKYNLLWDFHQHSLLLMTSIQTFLFPWKKLIPILKKSQIFNIFFFFFKNFRYGSMTDIVDHVFPPTSQSPQMALGTVHILRKHFHSTKTNLITYFFNITFWRNFHAVVWNF